MKTGAIICEYNPMHNGHAYHIEKTKKAGITHLVAVLSDDFVQRGDTALLNKFDRAELAVKAGADLVIELPVPYSCASAEQYARGAVQILNDLKLIDRISFGCSGSLPLLESLVSAELGIEKSARIQEFLKDGHSYPSAMYQALSEEVPAEVSGLLTDPNNLLALEYLKAMKQLKAEFEPLAVQRQSVMHDSAEPSGKFASASFIRSRFFSQGEYACYLPAETAKRLTERQNEGKTAEFSRLESVILYRIRMISEADLLSLPDMNPNLANRFRKAQTANSLEEFLHSVKSKCFTMARIRRILIYALLGIRREDLRMKIPYARILAFNRKGTELLKLCKSRSSIPLGTSLAELRTVSVEAERFAELETNTAHLYGLAQKQTASAETEFRQKIQLIK